MLDILFYLPVSVKTVSNNWFLYGSVFAFWNKSQIITILKLFFLELVSSEVTEFVIHHFEVFRSIRISVFQFFQKILCMYSIIVTQNSRISSKVTEEIMFVQKSISYITYSMTNHHCYLCQVWGQFVIWVNCMESMMTSLVHNL